MTNNGESIYKIRANFLKMKEHVTQTTRTTDENIIRCFVITFEYNITILLLLKFDRHNYFVMIYKCHYLAYFWLSAYTTLALNISYFQIIHSVDFITWQYISVWLLFFIVLLFFNISLNLTTTNMHIRVLNTWKTYSSEYMSK